MQIGQKILILGGGWCGSRLASLNPEKYIITSRKDEVLNQMREANLSCVKFDLDDESTFQNLPKEVQGILITFELLEEKVPNLKILLTNYSNIPLIVYGTGGVFKWADRLDVVTEDHPILDQYRSRVSGEDWALKYGASVLHLTGICGDENEDHIKFKIGTPRILKSWIHHISNGYSTVNLVHINDIVKVTEYAFENFSKFKSERVIVSAGAFRYLDFAKYYGIEIPLKTPDEDLQSFSRTKISSTKKINGLLPPDYQWTKILGIEPCSRGLPTNDEFQMHEMNGVEHDIQYELQKQNFSGKWQAEIFWYKRNDQSLEEFISFLSQDQLPEPTQKQKSQYHIYFIDADHGIWHGSGLQFAENGEKIISMTRSNFNSTGSQFCFPGMGAQITLNTHQQNNSTFGWEANFFYKRTRSMMIAMYKDVDDYFELNTIAIAPFRCGYGCEFPKKPQQSDVRRSPSKLLKGLDQMKSKRMWRSHKRALDKDDGQDIKYPSEYLSLLIQVSNERLIQSFDDDIICSLPYKFKKGGAAKFVIGVRHSIEFFQLVCVEYSENGSIEKYVHEKYFI